MSISTTDGTLTVTLPDIPYLTSYPLSFSLPTSTLRQILRLVVIISTYILFRPQLERLFRRATGTEDPLAPKSVEGMRREMNKLENERGVPLGGGRKVGATTSGAAAAGQSPKTRRKA